MMSAPATVALLLTAALTGWAFGRVFLLALRVTVEGFLRGGHVLLPIVLTVGRFAGAIVLFGVAARLGMLPLLATLLGFTVARAGATGDAMRHRPVAGREEPR